MVSIPYKSPSLDLLHPLAAELFALPPPLFFEPRSSIAWSNMAWKSLLVGALGLGAAAALRTKFTVNELQAIADNAAAQEDQYRQASVRGLAGGLQGRDTDPNLLYPAYNLSVPIDHFHNDSIYEPHVSSFLTPRGFWPVLLLAQCFSLEPLNWACLPRQF